MKCIPLPDPDLLPDMDINFLELIETRQSALAFEGESITLQELSYLLWCTQGVKTVLPDGRTMRNVPATHGIHALETIICIHHVDVLSPAIYRFLPQEHALEYLCQDAALMDAVGGYLCGTDSSRRGSVTFLWVANMPLAMAAYGDRSKQRVYIDVGYVCQNLYLTATALQLQVMKYDGADYVEIAMCIGLDADAPIVHGASVGR